jgi:hypothetical protein
MAEVYTISIMEMLRDEKQSHYIRLAWKLASETMCHEMDITGWLVQLPTAFVWIWRRAFCKPYCWVRMMSFENNGYRKRNGIIYLLSLSVLLVKV